MHIHAHLFQQKILTSKVGHTDIVSGVRSGFISGTVYAGLQDDVQRLGFLTPWLTSRHIDRQHFDQLI